MNAKALVSRIAKAILQFTGGEPSEVANLKDQEKAFERRLFDYYEDRYRVELEAKEKLNGRTTTLVAGITLAANICLYFANNYPPLGLPCFTGILFLISFGLGTIGLIAAIISLLWFFMPMFSRGYENAYIPTPKKIDRFLAELRDFNSAVSKEERETLEDAFQKNLLQQYSSCASHNFQTNAQRSKLAFTTTVFAVWAAFMLLIAGIPFIVLKKPFDKKLQEVKISAPVEMHFMSDQQNKAVTTDQPKLLKVEISDVHVKLAPEIPKWPEITLCNEAQSTGHEEKPAEKKEQNHE